MIRDLARDNRRLEAAQDGFALGQAEAEGLWLELRALDRGDVMDDLRAIVGDGNQADRELHRAPPHTTVHEGPIVWRGESRHGQAVA